MGEFRYLWINFSRRVALCVTATIEARHLWNIRPALDGELRFGGGEGVINCMYDKLHV